jgi:hypothetical protein
MVAGIGCFADMTATISRSTEEAKHEYGGVKLALERIDPDFGRKRRVGVSTVTTRPGKYHTIA